MKIALLMGSDSDFEVAKPAIDVIREFGEEVDVRILSAHRTPSKLTSYIKEKEEAGVKVFIAFAGKAAHLAGSIAANTIRPVIGVPVKSSTIGGLEALLSTAEMPSGVPVATVAINGAKNAGLLALQILAAGDEKLSAKLLKYKADMEEEIEEKNAKLNASLAEKL